MSAMGVLGDLSAQAFLQQHWQRKPLLVRGALPGYTSPVSPDELAGLSLETEVESRLVLREDDSGPWAVRHGPFADADFGVLPENDWTLLVQAVDLWVPQVRDLLTHFDFLPPWRFDDVMVSYAVEGGSVGPHFDEYDVFLLQVEGERCWQVGDIEDKDAALLTGTELRVLQDFEASHEWVLAPGDMLYLPPRVGHWGVAVNECLTYSIGFRAPTVSELLSDLAVELLAQERDVRYLDPPLRLDMASEEIAPEFVAQTKRLLQEALDDDALLGDWLARFMTQPKYPGLEEQTGEERRAHIDGVAYVNGEPL